MALCNLASNCLAFLPAAAPASSLAVRVIRRVTEDLAIPLRLQRFETARASASIFQVGVFNTVHMAENEQEQVAMEIAVDCSQQQVVSSQDQKTTKFRRHPAKYDEPRLGLETI